MSKIALLLSTACAASDESIDDKAPLEVRGRWVDWHTSGSSQIPCAGTIERLDAHVERVAGALGISLPSDYRVSLYYLPDAFELAPCDPTRGGCVMADDPRRAYTQVVPIPGFEHELVHSLAFEFLGRSTGLLEEGLAEALSGDWTPPAAEADDPRVLLDTPRSALTYDQAAYFVSHLGRTSGWGVVANLHAANARDAAAFEAAFAATVGSDFDEVATEYLAADSYCTFQWRCQGRAPHVIGLPEKMDEFVTCADDQVIGAMPLDDVFGNHWMQRDFGFALESAVRVGFTTNVPGELRTCGTCAEQWSAYWNVDQWPTARVLDLGPGDYFYSAQPSSDEPLVVELDLEAAR